MNSYRLKEIRVRRGYTQSEIADIINTTRETYNMYENGKIDPRVAAIVKLTELYDISADYLLGLTDIQHNLSNRKKTIIKQGK